MAVHSEVTNRKVSGLLKSLMTTAFVAAAASCGGGGGGGGEGGSGSGCDGNCARQTLTSADITKILRQAVTATKDLGSAGTFAVLDRVGNVLALYQMDGAPTTTILNGGTGATGGGLEGVVVPSTTAAISKAGTGAYLSSQGNAFSSRTASQIVQENFLPGEQNKPGGPLFGVQFSQLMCGDVTVLNSSYASGVRSGSKPAYGGSYGPRPLPLGLSGDPGGLPLYKDGDLVGGIGVEFDGIYTVDRGVFNVDDNPEERVALAAALGFEAPSDIRAEHIFVGGKSLRFSDLSYSDVTLPEELEALSDSNLKALVPYSDGQIHEGVQFGAGGSGIADTTRAGLAAMTLVSPAGIRFPSHSGVSLGGGIELKGNEVDALLDSALTTAARMRAGIRNPRDSAVRVSIFVVDTAGNPLGFTRSNDAPVFGIDVALQKARAAAFLSSPDAGAVLAGAPIGENYAARFASFTGGIPLNGQYAFSARGIGNLARPFFQDGINGNPPGPFSLPFPGSGAGRTWSPLNDGLQLDLVVGGIAGSLAVSLSGGGAIPDSCTSGSFGRRLRNGMQIFAGGVPLYRNGTLIGAIGVSGDGIDQDDMVAFFGSSRQGLDYVGHKDIGDPELGFNAPREIRDDKLPLQQENSLLRYVNCPEAPLTGDNEQNVCQGL